MRECIVGIRDYLARVFAEVAPHITYHVDGPFSHAPAHAVVATALLRRHKKAGYQLRCAFPHCRWPFVERRVVGRALWETIDSTRRRCNGQ